MDLLRQDLAYAVRTLLRWRGSTLVVILTLALGIGVTTAIYSVVHAVLVRPLPFPESDRLVVIDQQRIGGDGTPMEASYPDYRDWAQAATSFTGLAAVPSNAVPLVLEATPGSAAERVYGSLVSGSFFSILAVDAALGRTLATADDQLGVEPVAVLSHDLWATRFGSDPSVIGQRISLDATVATVVGVMPPRFEYPQGVDVWVPILPAIEDLAENRQVGFVRVLGRLSPGTDLDAADAEMDAIVARVAAEHHPPDLRVDARIRPLEEVLLGGSRQGLVLLLAAAAIVLLIACANVASLLLVRAASRREELAVRSALGATRGRLIRQLLVEGLVLSAVGGALGLFLSGFALDLLVAASPAELYGLREAGIDRGVLLFALGITATTGVLVTILPASRLRGPERLDTVLAGSAPASGAPGVRRVLGAVIVSEIALALIVLVLAGLLLRSLYELQRADLGYDAGRTLTAAVFLPPDRYREVERGRAFYDALIERIEAHPEVEAAAGVLIRPLEGPDGYDYPFTIEGRDPAEQIGYPLLNYEAVTPGYFAAAGLPLVRGRDFAATDSPDAPPVVIISRNVADRFWPGVDPVGQRIKWGRPSAPDEWVTIIGVAEDSRHRSLRSPSWNVYVPYTQSPWQLNHLVVRTVSDPAAVAALLEREVRGLDPSVRTVDVATLDELASTLLRAPRFQSGLLALFGLLALTLGGIGIYGVTAFAGAQRTKEIGIRMALGARRSDLGRLILRETLKLSAAGLAIGGIGAAAAARLLGGMVYNVAPLDGWTFVGVSLLLVTTSLIAAIGPARRATRLDPVEALRAG